MNWPSAQQKGVLPRSLSLETASTPYGTYSNIQLDPIEKQYIAENAAAYGSFSRGELQQLILTTQEQMKVDLQRLVESHKSHKGISKSRKLKRETNRKFSRGGRNRWNTTRATSKRKQPGGRCKQDTFSECWI